MKVLTYSHNGTTEVGILKNDGSQVVPVNYLGFDVKDMNEFLDTQDEEKLAKADRNKELMQGIPMEEVTKSGGESRMVMGKVGEV